MVPPVPDSESQPASDATPLTLEDLREELVAGASEARRGNRRTLEILKQFGETLDGLTHIVGETREAVRDIPRTPAAGGDDEELPRERARELADLADRVERVAAGFDRPPAATPGWWPGARKLSREWREAWAMQADAFEILRGHLKSMLSRAGLERMETEGRPFDPETMTAVESAVDAARPDHTVLAELRPGWRRAGDGELLRPAEVRVSRKPAE